MLFAVEAWKNLTTYWERARFSPCAGGLGSVHCSVMVAEHVGVHAAVVPRVTRPTGGLVGMADSVTNDFVVEYVELPMIVKALMVNW